MKRREREKYLLLFDKDFLTKALYFCKLFNLDIEAEDLAQEFRLKVWEGLGKWDKDLAVKSYINKICFNLVVDLLRKQKRKPKIINFSELPDEIRREIEGMQDNNDLF